MEIFKIEKFFFLGIGGASMNAIAQFLVRHKKYVFGYDRINSESTQRLAALGVTTTNLCSCKHLEEIIRKQSLNPDNTCVVYSSALRNKNENPLHFFVNRKYPHVDRGEILGAISREFKSLIVAGTHGKSTTSIVLSEILSQEEQSPHCFLGALDKRVKSNYWIGNQAKTVIEGDEYAKAMLKMHPDILAITSIDADHLDIYKTKENLQTAFKNFATKVPPDRRVIQHQIPIKGYKYALAQKADFSAQNISFDSNQRRYIFDLRTPFGNVDGVSFSMLGKHNLENAICAISMACLDGISPKKAAKSVAQFPGIQRRFETIFESKDQVVFHDFAHHPKEIEVTLQTAKHLFEGQKIGAIFQPHLFSRTQDFFKEFVDVLSQFDFLLLLPIYPARENPIEGVSSEILLEKIPLRKKFLVKDFYEIKEVLKNLSWQVLFTLGAGEDVHHISHSLTAYLKGDSNKMN